MATSRMALTGLVLAGGQGSRMGGRDKGLVEYKGRALVDHVIQCLEPQVDEILVSANRNLGDYAQRNCPVIVDDLPDFQGPLAGVLAGMQRAKHEWVLTVPCDMPHLPSDIAMRLFSASRGNTIVVATDGLHTHPALMLIHKSQADKLSDYLKSGKRSVHGFQESTGFASVRFEAHEMLNLNTLDELG